MQKLVLRLDIHEDLNCKKKAISLVSSIPGLDTISMDSKEKKLTIIGDMDPVAVVTKLREKNYKTHIISIGPVKESQTQKPEPKKQDKPKVSAQVHEAYNSYNHPQPHYYTYNAYRTYYGSIEEDPNGCVIC
ncbi:unnamed protein product [Amaranthus hypochondriacus]